VAEDKDLFGQSRNRRSGSDSGSNSSGRTGTPRTPSARSSPVGRPPRYGHGSFLSRVNKAVAKAHASKGTNRYSKSKPKTGRFNARGRGRRAYAAGVGPKKGWTVQNGMRYRARRVIVKARVSKLRGGGSRAAYAHLKYLQRDGIGNGHRREIGRHLNNRAENSHQPFRRRERAMSRFRRMRSLQKFASIHSSVYNHFNHQRNIESRARFKSLRDAALLEWRELIAA
jgi:DDE domain